MSQHLGPVKETFEQDQKAAKTIVVDDFDKSMSKVSKTPIALSKE